MEKRILCLDIGDKKIGVAVSDPLGKTGQALTVLVRKVFKKDCEAIVKIIQEYSTQKIIIGLPLNLRDEEGPQAKRVRFFAEGLARFLLEKKCPVNIELFDESFSSREAEAVLLEADLGRKKRKKVRDKLAAAIILQNYLDQQ